MFYSYLIDWSLFTIVSAILLYVYIDILASINETLLTYVMEYFSHNYFLYMFVDYLRLFSITLLI